MGSRSAQQKRAKQFENLISSIKRLNVEYESRPDKLIDFTLKAIYDPTQGIEAFNSDVAGQRALEARWLLGVTEWDTGLHTATLISNLVSDENFGKVTHEMNGVIGQTVRDATPQKVPQKMPPMFEGYFTVPDENTVTKHNIEQIDQALDKLTRLAALVSKTTDQVQDGNSKPNIKEEQLTTLQRLQNQIEKYQSQLAERKVGLKLDLDLSNRPALNKALKNYEKLVQKAEKPLLLTQPKTLRDQFVKLRLAIARDLGIGPVAEGNEGEQTPGTETLARTLYRKLALQTHPDKGGTQELFTELSNAHDEMRKELKKLQS